MKAVVIVILAVAAGVLFTFRRVISGWLSARAAIFRGRTGPANSYAGAGEKLSADDFVESANAASRAARQSSAAALGSPPK